MSTRIAQAEVANRLLRTVGPASFERLSGKLERVDLSHGQVIDFRERRTEWLYFVDRGLVSMVKTLRDGRAVEVSAVGIEGITDPCALFGLELPILDAIVQVPGTAFRIRRESLEAETGSDPKLAWLLRRYARFAFTQMAQTAACNRLHSLRERCCRWLLVAQDSVGRPTFPLTHEFLAMMLGVARASLSVAIGGLRDRNLIDYRRGHIWIVDRDGLEAAACECYGELRAELDAVFAPAQPAPTDALGITAPSVIVR